MKISEKIYDFVVFDRGIKIIIASLLRSPLLLKNPVYNFYYDRLLRIKMEKFKDKPFRVMIENTNFCNADCVFCPHRIMKRKIGIMEMKLFKKIIDQCKVIGIDYVTIYGFGEPFLDKYFFERLKYAKKAGIFRITTNTNGMYLTKEKVSKLLNIGIDEVFISFDATSEEVYKQIRPGLDFKTVENNILYLVNEKKRRRMLKPEISLSFVEFDKNRQETGKYIKKWGKIVDHISFSYIHNWTGAVESGGKLRVGRRDPCRLLWTDMVISWNGGIPLCCNDYENKIILGNIKNSSIKKIWGGEKLRQLRDFHKKKDFNRIAICKNCEYNYHHKSPWWVAK